MIGESAIREHMEVDKPTTFTSPPSMLVAAGAIEDPVAATTGGRNPAQHCLCLSGAVASIGPDAQRGPMQDWSEVLNARLPVRRIGALASTEVHSRLSSLKYFGERPLHRDKKGRVRSSSST